MPKDQQFPVSEPIQADKETLRDFSTTIQRNFEELFQVAHSHEVLSSLPAGTTGGASEDIKIVDDGTTVYLVVRTSRGWFRTSSLTAL